jgi:sulfoxide reductase heme-binding subunit YedZ
MAVGITGGWMLALLGLSYYARARIGVARWRTLHRFTALAWLLGIAHAIGLGTDTGTAWFLLALAAVALPALGLLAMRLAQPAATTS